ncbi:MAG: hypothetical protein P4L46_21410 [Fimbriimonas sp.]|nr:hypothetical protein [Fimbriimonas sp.]
MKLQIPRAGGDTSDIGSNMDLARSTTGGDHWDEACPLTWFEPDFKE